MKINVRVAPTTTVANTAEGVLNYLVRRTSETVGKRIVRAELIVIGEVIETGGQSVAVKTEDAVLLRPWFSGEASASPSIMLYRTLIRVEQWLKGPGETNTIEIAYVPRWQSVGSEQLPLFNLHAQGLVYLCRISSSLPYGAYLPAQSYQLAPGETALRSYSGINKAAAQQPEEAEAAAAEGEVDAVRWYVGLPTESEDRSKSLFAGLDNTNPRIVRQAIRELAERHATGSAERFTEMLKSASDELRVRLMLGLWILGKTDVAVALLQHEFSNERESWLARWGLQETQNEAGGPADILFGPEPELNGQAAD